MWKDIFSEIVCDEAEELQSQNFTLLNAIISFLLKMTHVDTLGQEPYLHFSSNSTLYSYLQYNSVLVIFTEDNIFTDVHTCAYHVTRWNRTKLVSSWAWQGEKCEVIWDHLLCMQHIYIHRYYTEGSCLVCFKLTISGILKESTMNFKRNLSLDT